MVAYLYSKVPKSRTLVKKMSKFHELTPLDRRGEPFPFSQLEGKTVLIVNVASKCGFTPQYKELEELYKKYKDQGFVVIGFPCNQFGHQEPSTDEEIGQFCQLNFGVTFPVLKKINVNGPEADPVYEYLKAHKSGMLGFKAIKWNFEKFLVDGKGNVVERYSSLTKPSSIEKQIEKLLGKNGK
ncbi:HER033Wp [Eremothecium sinecaudum]|uniref:Glutathione peroxidase n=1 Tax=Eremothecium sinecaudum TaxID=45286 RepID=A0A0X8HTS0_9SACH|nr:HER033Wp [Eremothecium sinecaudum]AMD21312.1 HER033Wp [Eremothecium sinecaudum]